MNLEKIAAPDFDLQRTLDSGQVFHWEARGSGYAGTMGDRAAYAEQRGSELFVNREIAEIAPHYFALDHPLREICAAFPRDPAMDAARSYCNGLRIMRQPIWECLATFITSSMKQVAHIRQMSRALRESFGAAAMIYGSHVYAFPSAARLARGDGEGTAGLRAGVSGEESPRYRAAGGAVAKPIWKAWRELTDDELRGRALRVAGRGRKGC